MGIAPIEVCIQERKLGLVIRLLKNETTKNLVQGSLLLKKILESQSINDKSNEEIYLYCRDKRLQIEKSIQIIENTEIVQVTRYFLENPTENNNDTLQFLLDPRRRRFKDDND